MYPKIQVVLIFVFNKKPLEHKCEIYLKSYFCREIKRCIKKAAHVYLHRLNYAENCIVVQGIRNECFQIKKELLFAGQNGRFSYFWLIFAL